MLTLDNLKSFLFKVQSKIYNSWIVSNIHKPGKQLIWFFVHSKVFFPSQGAQGARGKSGRTGSPGVQVFLCVY